MSSVQRASHHIKGGVASFVGWAARSPTIHQHAQSSEDGLLKVLSACIACFDVGEMAILRFPGPEMP
jgi:hypothetical protein